MCNGKFHRRHKAGIDLNDERFMTHCQVCGKPAKNDRDFAYMGGQYHYPKCYDVLFDKCEDCGHQNMAVPVNEHYHNEKLCDECRNKKHGWSVVTIVFR